ncbi:hypothetical protein T440DRAFT_234734 [Plenodomus tracheiphilus IPT5]|uniref:Uncharacterized protein n=1 Tax=Plenodomus tracheiphilus IPT5 TaxID=1408161 RepID=A0A6A7BK67_9PLEO|nr:hypothetical protein T440DRAFT_234734 [Plenodomus tracheiphilus IPT5]
MLAGVQQREFGRGSEQWAVGGEAETDVSGSCGRPRGAQANAERVWTLRGVGLVKGGHSKASPRWPGALPVAASRVGAEAQGRCRGGPHTTVGGRRRAGLALSSLATGLPPTRPAQQRVRASFTPPPPATCTDCGTVYCVPACTCGDDAVVEADSKRAARTPTPGGPGKRGGVARHATSIGPHGFFSTWAWTDCALAPMLHADHVLCTRPRRLIAAT